MNSLTGATGSWSLVAGVLVPLLLAVVQQPYWPASARAIVAAAGAAVAAVVTCAANHTLRWGMPLGDAFLVVLTVAQASYHGLWKPTVAPVIERVTSPRPPRPGLETKHVP